MALPNDLLRVAKDDPDYVRRARAEAEFWEKPHPWGLEASEEIYREGPVDRHINERFTGDPDVRWHETIARHGKFRRGLVLGTSALRVEADILGGSPSLHLTFVDISPGALERRQRMLGQRFGGRVAATETADLNFIDLPPATYDLIVSSSTLHHVTNLEYLAWQINRALTPEGRFFLQDYVGEPRFAASEPKRRLFEAVYHRDLARQPDRRPGLIWCDASDLSPFCGVRSDEILAVLRSHLIEVELHTASTLTIPLLRSRPADGAHERRPPWWLALLRALRRRLPMRVAPVHELWLGRQFLEELFLVGDTASDAGLLLPGTAFAVYRKR